MQKDPGPTLGSQVSRKNTGLSREQLDTRVPWVSPWAPGLDDSTPEATGQGQVETYICGLLSCVGCWGSVKRTEAHGSIGETEVQ